MQALQGGGITVFGTGRQTRSFMYVDDLTEGLYRLLQSSYSGPVNLGNPDEKTLLELAQIIKSLTDSKSKIVFRDLPQDDPRVRCPDTALAKKLLRWEPRVGLKDGLLRTIEYFRSLAKGQGRRLRAGS
jgi:nucleoside-diphosphate-sugar epimerase